MNTVIKCCNHCGLTRDQDKGEFGYLDDGIWQCRQRLSKYTHIVEVLNRRDEE